MTNLLKNVIKIHTLRLQGSLSHNFLEEGEINSEQQGRVEVLVDDKEKEKWEGRGRRYTYSEEVFIVHMKGDRYKEIVTRIP